MLSIQEQIWGVSLIWSEAKYNFAFWNVRKNISWDAEYQKLLDKVTQPMKLIDYYLELCRFISLLNDGHTCINFPDEIIKNYLPLPIKIKNYGSKHIVVNKSENCNIPMFSEIYKLNGVEFNKYMNEKIMPYCWNIKPTSTYELLYPFWGIDENADKNAYAFISIIEENKDIELETSSGKFVVTPGSANNNWALPQKLNGSEKLDEIFSSKGLIISYTHDNIAVITLPTFMDEDMPENFYSQLNTLKNCRGFVIDVRNNGGGMSNYADAFSQAFIKGEFQTGKVKHPIHNGAYKAWASYSNVAKMDLTNTADKEKYDNDPWIKKVYDTYHNDVFEEEITTAYYPNCPLTLNQPVVILENAATGSSAENLLINFDNIGRATIVGVPSYGTTGNPLFIKLPGGGLARICTRRYTYPNNKEFINIGIEPHIYADLTLDDLQNSRDSVLDKGLNVLREQLAVG
ncbi:MAG: S41 family peptidase [Defluviitaleaceae bacterium]|nr:S41 family peptidase [Defluviitaleaceae bacterium]